MNEVFAKHNIICLGKRRDYLIDNHNENIDLDLSSPVSLKFLDVEIRESSWIHLIHSFGKVLVQRHNPKEEDLLKYKSEWSPNPIFISRAAINYKKLSPTLYINCKFTAKESYQLIKDLLSYFGIDPIENLQIIVHRQPSSEPEEIQKIVVKETKEEFKNYLMNEQGKDEQTALKIISNIEIKLDPFLRSITRTYNTFFHFDSIQQLANYSTMYRKKIMYNKNMTDKNKSIINRYLNYLNDFYSSYLN